MENAKEIVEIIGGLIVIIGAVAAVLRYATATPLDRLMMDGIDKTGVKIYPFFFWLVITAFINFAIGVMIFALADSFLKSGLQMVPYDLLAFIAAAIIIIPMIIRSFAFIIGKAKCNKRNAESHRNKKWICLILKWIYFILTFVFASPYIFYYLAKIQGSGVKTLVPLIFVSIFETVNIFVTCKDIFPDDPQYENIFISCCEKDFYSKEEKGDPGPKKHYRCLEIKDGYVFCIEMREGDNTKIVRLISLENIQKKGISFEMGADYLKTTKEVTSRPESPGAKIGVYIVTVEKQETGIRDE